MTTSTSIRSHRVVPGGPQAEHCHILFFSLFLFRFLLLSLFRAFLFGIFLIPPLPFPFDLTFVCPGLRAASSTFVYPSSRAATPISLSQDSINSLRQLLFGLSNSLSFFITLAFSSHQPFTCSHPSTFMHTPSSCHFPLVHLFFLIIASVASIFG